MEEVIRKIVSEVAAYDDKTEEKIIKRYAKRALNYALLYCHRDDVPDRMLDIIVELTESLMKSEMEEQKGKVQSVTRGDTSITYYHEKREIAQLGFNERLNAFRKLGLLRKSDE